MNNLLSTSEIVAKYQLRTKKNLGQNFIFDKNFTDKIAKSAGDLSAFEVLEIGAGPGGLSRSILDNNPQKLIAIEKDERCVGALQELKNFYGTKFEIISEDALKIDETAFFSSQKKFKIIANLPYNIGTALIFKWLKILPKIESMHVMLQKEVVERIIAKSGDNHYGRLAVMINLLCDTKKIFDVNKMVFSPPPRVDSAVVAIVPNQQKIAQYFDEKHLPYFEKTVQIAFSQRRKKIKSSLKTFYQNYAENDWQNFFEVSGVDPNKRAEEIAIENFWKLSKMLYPKL